ncbi:MAG: hypothetical protein ACRD0Z_16130 [Acidimicrobiales bacterium]
MTATDTEPPDCAPGRRGDALPLLVLAAVPVVVFCGAYFAFGRVLLVGDNLIQNYPLRALVGQQLRHGVFPAWDPWIFGGTPLLAGLNAGALYPVTWLFAVLNDGLAWVLNEVFVYASVAIGTYVFLRLSGTRRLAGFLGALSFACAGAVAGQGAVHIDMSEGFAALPWLLIAVRQVIADGRWRWCWLLAGSVCVLVLSGSPEAILYVGALALAYAVVRLTVTPRAGPRFIAKAGLGALGGLGASAMVWIPALAFIATSQRSDETASFASSFSYPPKELLLGVVPFLLGGSKLFSQPVYFGQSNLPEVTMYVGILPLIALGALTSRRWRQRLPAGERRACLAIAVVGVVLAIGAGTPLGHLIIHIPMYGEQRDQGRNIVDLDFAACCALAWWLDGGNLPERARARTETWAAAGLVTVVAAVAIAVAVFGDSFWRWMRATPQPSDVLGSIWVGIAVAGALAAGGAAVAFASHRMAPQAWRRLATAFVVADLALFAGGSYLWSASASPSVAQPGPVFKLVSANLPGGGRYAVYNPDLFYPSTLVDSAEPDIGIVVGDASAEGYTAIQNRAFSAGTATHQRNSFSPRDFSEGRFSQLDLDVVTAPAEYFLLPVAGAPESTAGIRFAQQGPHADPLMPGGNVPLAQDNLPRIRADGPSARLAPAASTGWYFGTTLSPTSGSVLLLAPAAGQVVQVGTLSQGGALAWGPPLQLDGTASAFRLPGTAAVGVELRLVSGPPLLDYEVAIGQAGHEFLLDGPLSRAVTPAAYSPVGEADNMAVFRSRSTPPVAWVQPLGTQNGIGGPQDAGGARVISQTTDSESIAIDASQPELLARSVSYDAGWHASILSGSAAAVANAAKGLTSGDSLRGGHKTPVTRVDLVQGVSVPAGWSVVSFSYEAPGLATGELATGATAAAALIASAVWLVFSRRRRPLTPFTGGGR